MRITSALLCTLFIATTAYSEAIKIDPVTGLWYPPYASSQAYLKREAPYIADVARAWRENPGLMKAVCEALYKAPQPQSNDGSVMQLRTMLQMQCVSAAAGEVSSAREASFAARRYEAILPLFKQEEAAVAAMPPAQRNQAAADLQRRIGGDEAGVRAAFRAIALAPAYTDSAYELLSIPTDLLLINGSQYQKKHLTAFVGQLYSTNAKSDRTDAAEWKAGLPAVLLFLGDVDQARTAAAEWASVAPADRVANARAMVAVVDRVQGRAGALQSFVNECRQSVTASDARSEERRNACYETPVAVVRGALDALKDRAPRGLVDAGYELIRIQPQHWPAHMTLLGDLRFADPVGSSAGLYDVLENTTAPEGATLDAVYYLAKIAVVENPAAAAPLIDCWLQRKGAVVPPLPADAWQKLASMEEGTFIATGGGDCFGPGMSKIDSVCALHILQLRAQSAMDARQWDVARQSIEKLLAIVLASHGGPSLARDALINLAVAEREAGLKDEPAAICGYLANQPHDGYVAEQLQRAGTITAPHVQQPWAAPARLDPEHQSFSCPPARPKARAAVRPLPAPHVETPEEYEAALRRKGYAAAGAIGAVLVIALIIRRHA